MSVLEAPDYWLARLVFQRALAAIYVIATGGLLGHDVVVSPELLETARPDGNEIVLNISKHQLDELAHYESDDYTTPPAEWLAPSNYGFPTGGYLWPVAEGDVAPEERAIDRRGPRYEGERQSLAAGGCGGTADRNWTKAHRAQEDGGTAPQLAQRRDDVAR